MSVEMNEAAKEEQSPKGRFRRFVGSKVGNVKRTFEEKANERKELREASEVEARKAYRKSYIKAKVAKAREQGRRKGGSSFGGGVLGALATGARFAKEHVGVLSDPEGFGLGTGSSKGRHDNMGMDTRELERSLSMSGSGFGLDGSTKKRKRDPYADLGL